MHSQGSIWVKHRNDYQKTILVRESTSTLPGLLQSPQAHISKYAFNMNSLDKISTLQESEAQEAECREVTAQKLHTPAVH